MNFRLIKLLILSFLFLMILFIPKPVEIIGAILIISFICIIVAVIMGILKNNYSSLMPTFTALILKTITVLIIIIEIVLRPEIIVKLTHQITGFTAINDKPILWISIVLTTFIFYYYVFKNIIIRNSEIFARFALDSLPGKKMTIDSSVEFGSISIEEAHKEIDLLKKQTNKAKVINNFTRFLHHEGYITVIIYILIITAYIIRELYTTGVFFTDSTISGINILSITLIFSLAANLILGKTIINYNSIH